MVISRIKWKIIYVGHYAKWLSLLSWIVAKFRLKTPSPSPSTVLPRPTPALSCRAVILMDYKRTVARGDCKVQPKKVTSSLCRLPCAVVLEWTNWATDWRGAVLMLFTVFCLRLVATWSVLYVDFRAKESSWAFYKLSTCWAEQKINTRKQSEIIIII